MTVYSRFPEKPRGMTDREYITAIVGAFCERWRETRMSLYIYDRLTKIIFTREGEIKTVIKNHMAFGPEGVHAGGGTIVGVYEDGAI